MHRSSTLAALVAGAALTLTGCHNSSRTHEHVARHEARRDATTQPGATTAAGAPGEARHAHMWESVSDAVAVLHPTKDSKVQGTVRFTQQGETSVRVVAHVEGLAPNSTHGFHVHEFGDCSAPDASSAGGHYDPEHHQHGKPDAELSQRHPGDMGNLTANGQGVADLTLTLQGVSVAGMRNPVIGRAVIVHEKADDFGQPTGNAGGRLACGVIGVAKK